MVRVAKVQIQTAETKMPIGQLLLSRPPLLVVRWRRRATSLRMPTRNSSGQRGSLVGVPSSRMERVIGNFHLLRLPTAASI